MAQVPLLRFFAVPSGKEPRLALLAHGILMRLGSGSWGALRSGADSIDALPYVQHLRECLLHYLRPPERPQLAADIQVPPLGHLRRRCRALRLDDVCHLAHVRVGGERALLPDLRLRGSKFTFSEVERRIPGRELPDRAQCVDEDVSDTAHEELETPTAGCDRRQYVRRLVPHH